jgi:competence CoiA-like predicted nuclease
MQLYALDKSSLVLASHAVRDRSYLCPECHGLVRIRGGGRRQIHFYHARRPATCRQHGKSLAHLQIQLHLKSLIPSLTLEKRFECIPRLSKNLALDTASASDLQQAQPLRKQAMFKNMADGRSCKDDGLRKHIKCPMDILCAEQGAVQNQIFGQFRYRIADACWIDEKIVFEVQCSPITLQEAKTRCEDYRKLGFTPVWILHDRRYNRFKLTPAEEYLRSQTTTFYSDGRSIYDQFDVCQSLRRVFRGPKIVVNPAKPQKKALEPLFSRNWPLSFHGDLFHRITPQQLEHLKKIQKMYQKKRRWNLWKRAYRFLLYRLLEQTSL